jgi:hypothetical protein
MANLMSMKARGENKSMNSLPSTKKSQHPENKDPSEVTPGPQYQQEGENTSPPIKMKLPKALAKGTSHGEAAHYLASGHHVKNADGSTSFHMHALDGEPVSADNMDSSTEDGETGSGMGTEGDPYGVATALKGMSA